MSEIRVAYRKKYANNFDDVFRKDKPKKGPKVVNKSCPECGGIYVAVEGSHLKSTKCEHCGYTDCQ